MGWLECSSSIRYAIYAITPLNRDDDAIGQTDDSLIRAGDSSERETVSAGTVGLDHARLTVSYFHCIMTVSRFDVYNLIDRKIVDSDKGAICRHRCEVSGIGETPACQDETECQHEQENDQYDVRFFEHEDAMTFQRRGALRLNHTVAILLIAGLIIAQCGCGNNATREALFSGEDYLLNTYCRIDVYAMRQDDARPEEAAEAVIRDAFAFARSLEAKLSRTLAESDVAGINESEAGIDVPVSEETAFVIERGLYFAALSQGAFDITVGALSELWDFSAVQPERPDDAAIERALATVEAQGVELWKEPESGEAFVRKQRKGTKIDLGGIAKGYIADRTKEYMVQQGVESALLNFGGNVVVLGQKAQDVPWVIGLEQPELLDDSGARNLIGRVNVYSGSVVTSGVYERTFVQDGVRYHHLLDPATGWPKDSDLLSATIIGPSSTDCDALSTVCMLFGRERATALVEELEGYEAVFVGRDGEVTWTQGAEYTAYDEK